MNEVTKKVKPNSQKKYPYKRTTRVVFALLGEEKFEKAMDILMSELDSKVCYIMQTDFSDNTYFLTLSCFRNELGKFADWRH